MAGEFVIKSPDDLERIKKMNIIKVFAKTKWGTCESEGYFSGIFQIKNKIYFTLSNAKASKEYQNAFFLSTNLYEIKNNKIIKSFFAITGYCGKDKLEDQINRRVKSLKKLQRLF